ncbi:MAG: PEBP family protein [Chloroflexota bacterium]
MKKVSIIVLVLSLLVACGGADEVASIPGEAATSAPPIEAATSAPPTEAAIAEPTAAPTASEPDATPVDTPVEEGTDEAEAETATTSTFQLDAWADNWFAAYLGEELIVEDSVSIETERSFNAETTSFEASYPLQLNFILKDFKENDTGLEYIGEPNQQMGDGGFIMQLTDMVTGNVVAVSNADCDCIVIHEAPLDKVCESESNPVAGTAPCEFSDLGEPDGWKQPDFDDSGWTATTVHSADAVQPRDGYDEIAWDASAELIWGPDLETNNTILCRLTVEAP